MKNLIKLSVLSILFTLSASADTFCDKGDCKDVSLDSDKGSQLLNFTDEQKKVVAPSKDRPGDKNFANPGNQSHWSELKWNNFSVGTCLIDVKSKVFYKILKKKNSNKQVVFVSEKEVHNYVLKVNTIFFDNKEAKAFRHLQKWSCNRTANLQNNDYINKCVGSSNFGEKMCDTPSVFK